MAYNFNTPEEKKCLDNLKYTFIKKLFFSCSLKNYVTEAYCTTVNFFIPETRLTVKDSYSKTEDSSIICAHT